MTQENASSSNELTQIASEIESLSKNLTTVINTVSFDENAKNQVCDTELTNIISGYRGDHIKFKATQYEKLDEFTSFKVTNHHQCKMGKWIEEQEKQSSGFTQNSAWSKLKVTHEHVHGKVQSYVDKNAQRVEMMSWH